MTIQPTSAAGRISAALDHVEQIVAKCRQSCDALVSSRASRPIRAVGIVGAGIMGAAIAREHAAHGIPVVLCDTDPAALGRARSACFNRDSAFGAGREFGNSGASIRYTQSLADLDGCDLVLESIAEKRLAKEAVYRQLAPLYAKGIVVATNTSAIPISRLASGLASPARFCGMHFCHPVQVRPLVEIISGAETTKVTIATVVAHTLSLGKLPLVVQDGPGFVVNRLLHAYLISALDLLVAGAPPCDIDAAMTRFDMPMGPLAQLDEIGLDTALSSGIVMSEAMERRSTGTRLLLALSKAKQFGRKSGVGIYLYPAKCANPSLEAFIAIAREESGNGLPTAKPTADLLLAEMTAQAGRLISEEKIFDSWQIDIATIFGLGFPCWRGGLLWWANQGIE